MIVLGEELYKIFLKIHITLLKKLAHFLLFRGIQCDPYPETFDLTKY
jgi:hypothetical protein